jgi:hypothetical protein
MRILIFAASLLIFLPAFGDSPITKEAAVKLLAMPQLASFKDFKINAKKSIIRGRLKSK